MTEQNRDATSYIECAVNACQRRLNLLSDAHRRGVHTDAEHDVLRLAIIAETEQAWDVSLNLPCT
jgi:hypothetical protein